MLVIADRSPLNYLILIHEVDLVTALFVNVVVPTAVLQEMLDKGAPEEVRRWASDLPGWVDVIAPRGHVSIDTEGLGAGETAALQIASENDPSSVILLIDDLRARIAAERAGIRFVGTLGVIGQAAAQGLIDFDDAVQRLRATSFYAPEAIISAMRNSLRK